MSAVSARALMTVFGVGAQEAVPREGRARRSTTEAYMQPQLSYSYQSLAYVLILLYCNSTVVSLALPGMASTLPRPPLGIPRNLPLADALTSAT
jgi:hypothetical protein